jgi:hypothetical protein
VASVLPEPLGRLDSGRAEKIRYSYLPRADPIVVVCVPIVIRCSFREKLPGRGGSINEQKYELPVAGILEVGRLDTVEYP